MLRTDPTGMFDSPGKILERWRKYWEKEFKDNPMPEFAHSHILNPITLVFLINPEARRQANKGMAHPIPKTYRGKVPSLIFNPNHAKKEFERGNPEYTVSRAEGADMIAYGIPETLAWMFIPLGTDAPSRINVVDRAGRNVFQKSERHIGSLNQTYNLGLKSSRASVLSANRKIYCEFVENGGCDLVVSVTTDLHHRSLTTDRGHHRSCLTPHGVESAFHCGESPRLLPHPAIPSRKRIGKCRASPGLSGWRLSQPQPARSR
jgi:hypothetical protein